ncbi:MAG: hypothetical protein ABI723_08580 [Bacteroidia bacterium]
MRQAITTRLWKYCKSIIVIVGLAILLAHGPHGGWIVGFIAALFLGFVLTATIWLLDFKWYLNMACGLLISAITLLIFIPLTKQTTQIQLNETLSNFIDCLIVLSLFSLFIELTNYIGRLISKRKVADIIQTN